jgi:hypothetical protein
VKIQPQWVLTPGKQTNKQTNLLYPVSFKQIVGFATCWSVDFFFFNLLAPEYDISILAHPVCKM